MAEEASRRSVLLALASAALAACGGARRDTPEVVKPAALPPLKTEKLTDLLALAHLRWLIVARPRDIASTPSLIPAINSVVKEENLNLFAKRTGVDLREVREAAIASYVEEGVESRIWLARHAGDAGVIERSFGARLTTGVHRTEDRADVVRLAGKIGAENDVMVLLGRDVVGVQTGGSAARGPARIAALYALERLKKSPTALAEDPLKGLAERFHAPPLMAFALGPFEGELARGARGLLAGATAIGAAARPSAREGIDLAIVVAGDFSKSGAPASRELAAAWDDLANGSFGRLLGLDRPVAKPLATFFPEGVAIALEIDPDKLAKGLVAATSARVDEIMR